MNIVVCVKQVLDTAAKIEIEDGQVAAHGIPRIINPYDEFAIEEAIRIKEKREEVQATLLTLGPEKSRDALRTGLAMGADEAIHIMNTPLESLDSFGVALVLARAVQTLPHDLVLCGRQAVDDDMAQVGPTLAVLLGIPYICFVTKLELSDDNRQATVTRQIEGGSEILEASLPLLLTCQKGLNEPRLPSLKGIMKAKKKEVKILDADILGIDLATLVESRVIQTDLVLPPERKKGIILEGSLQDSTFRLVNILRNDLKII